MMLFLYASMTGTCVVQQKQIPRRPAKYDGLVMLHSIPEGTDERAIVAELQTLGELVPTDRAQLECEQADSDDPNDGAAAANSTVNEPPHRFGRGLWVTLCLWVLLSAALVVVPPGPLGLLAAHATYYRRLPLARNCALGTMAISCLCVLVCVPLAAVYGADPNPNNNPSPAFWGVPCTLRHLPSSPHTSTGGYACLVSSAPSRRTSESP